MTVPRRVLMTADTVGGVWEYSLELSRSLGCQGTRVSLATMGRPLSSSQREQAGAVEGLDIHESTYKLEWMDCPWPDVDAAGEWLMELEREVDPDIVHLNGFVHGSLPWSAPAVVVGHSCVSSWWNAVLGCPAPPEWHTYRRRVRDGLHGASAVAAVSGFIATELNRWYGPLSGIDVVYNCRRASEYAPGDKEPIVFSSGRVWDEAKNAATLDRAAQHLRWPVYVAGEDGHPEGGTAGFESIRTLGRLSASEMAEWYGRAAIYALPAKYEPFGLSILEAASAGCALVLGDIASLREIWADAAIFVPADDAASLADAVNTLAADDRLRKELAARARGRALTFTPERQLQGYVNLYERARASAGREARFSCAL